MVSIAVHPGIVRTEVTRNLGFFLHFGQLVATPIMMYLQKTPLQGAYCSIYAATSGDIGEGGRVGGGVYLEESEVTEVGRGARHDEDNKKLWRLSEDLTGLINK